MKQIFGASNLLGDSRADELSVQRQYLHSSDIRLVLGLHFYLLRHILDSGVFVDCFFSGDFCDINVSS